MRNNMANNDNEIPRNTAGNGSFSELMTESELVDFLRIPELSNAKKHSYVIENLKRMHDLPCIHICKKPLYPLNAVRNWVDEKLLKEQQ
jgi:hypothetical protein